MNIARRITSPVVALLALVALASVAHAAEADNAAKEKALLETLRTAQPADKAIACKELAVYGTAQSVDELAKLLTDEQLASWSRIALEAIPGPEASAALRKALPAVKGRLLVGTINSIGVRRDEGAVDQLIALVKDQDTDAASAAAVALGHIGNAAATKSLRGSLASAPAKVRPAVAEGCILCAEQLMNAGKTKEAVEIYDEVRKADVPKQKKLESTRGAILARKADGIPLLLEQLRSDDVSLFRLGLSTARELAGPEVGDALVAEVTGAKPERAALLLVAFADRPGASVTPTVIEVAKSGPGPVRLAAIGVIGRLGDAASLPALLDIAGETDAEIVEQAKAALASLPGENTDEKIAAQLSEAQGKALPILIELVGQRRINATPALVKAVDHSDPTVRGAALRALGATVGPKDLSILVAQAIAPKNPGDAEAAQKALREASVRMPDREACAAELAAAMGKAPVATKSMLLEILGQVGGANALATIGSAVKGTDEPLQDTGSRVLGEWMELDAAPVLLDLAKTVPSDKYRNRAFRGYLRLARQFSKSDQQRAEMCQAALDASSRAEDQKLVLAVLERYPSTEGLNIVIAARQVPELKDEATRVAMVIIGKLGPKAGNVQELLNKLGQDPGAAK